MKYPFFQVNMLEIYHNATNRQMFQQVVAQYGVKNPGVPLILIGNRTLLGEDEIKQHLEENILEERAGIIAGTELHPIGNSMPTIQITLPLVVFSAMVDSINPCGFAVLIFLLVSLAVAGNSRRILCIGGTYIAALFAFHLLVGIGLFSAFSFSAVSKGFSLAGAALAVVLGLITLIDAIRNQDVYLLSIPASKKSVFKEYFLKASLPAAFMLGILAGVFGFSCTGGIYISLLCLMCQNLTALQSLPYLVIYNIIFVLPLVLVTFLVAFGLPPERVEHWRTENRRTVRLIVGSVMVILGAAIFLGWFG
jgi:cytochrome c biogenesis protein CcdA